MNFKAYFTEDDKAKVIKFLNLVATHAKFDVSTTELIDFYKHLQYMQQGILPKIENNIFEVKRIIEEKDRAEAEENAEAESGDE